MPPKEICTPRLLLRFPVPSDADSVYEKYGADEVVARYVMWTTHKTKETVSEFIRERILRIETGQEFSWCISLPDGAGVIGMIGARVCDHKVDIGYVLAREYWNRGYMTEAISTVAEWLLSQPSIFRVWAVCDTENIGSARALEKSAFVREGVLRRWVVHPNRSDEPRDCYVYARTR